MSQFQASDFSFVRHRPGQATAEQTATAGSLTTCQAAPEVRPLIRLPDAPALAVRKSLLPLPSVARQPVPQAQHAQHAQHADQQQALPVRSKLSAGPAWKRVVRDSPNTAAAQKAAPPLINKLAHLVKTPVQLSSSGLNDQKHVAGVLPANTAPSHNPVVVDQQTPAASTLQQGKANLSSSSAIPGKDLQQPSKPSASDSEARLLHIAHRLD